MGRPKTSESVSASVASRKRSASPLPAQSSKTAKLVDSAGASTILDEVAPETEPNATSQEPIIYPDASLIGLPDELKLMVLQKVRL
jgi:hypothetical protein